VLVFIVRFLQIVFFLAVLGRYSSPLRENRPLGSTPFSVRCFFQFSRSRYVVGVIVHPENFIVPLRSFTSESRPRSRRLCHSLTRLRLPLDCSPLSPLKVFLVFGPVSLGH